MNNTIALERSQLIGLASAGQLTGKEVSEKLNLSIRQIRRLVEKFRKGGASVFFVKPPRNPWNRTKKGITREILGLKREGPWRSNQYISELVEEKLNKRISKNTVRKILIANNLYEKDKTQRKAFNHLEERIKSFGQMVQFDVCEGCWLKGFRRVYLICFMDAYSRYIVGWQWVASNNAWNNICVLRSVAAKYGVPGLFYTDNASFYKVIRHEKSPWQNQKPQDEYETTIQRIILDLGSIMVNHKPYQPQGKGRIERFFRFMQNRFIREHTAKNLEELNKQFKPWVKWYNTKHIIRTIQQKPKDRLKPSSFKPVNQDLDLNRIFSYHYTRKIDKYNSFSFEGKRYFISSKNCLEWRGCLTACAVDLCATPETITVYHDDKLVQKFKRKSKESN